MSGPAVGKLTPADLAIGETVHMSGIGNNRRAEPTTAVVKKIGRKLVTVELGPPAWKWTSDVVLRLDTQVENGDFAGWSFRTAAQFVDDQRRAAARERLAAHGVQFVDGHMRSPLADRLVDVDLAETLADAADRWAAQ